MGVLVREVEGDGGGDGRCCWLSGLSGRRKGEVRGEPIERGEGL